MKYFVVLVFGLLSIQLTSCEKQNNQTKMDSASFRAEKSNNITYEEIDIFCTQSPNGEYIIKNNEEYYALLDSRSPHPDCENYVLPVIDFNQYTLLGYVTGVSGCNIPVISHEFVRDGDNFIFTLFIEVNGFCLRNNPVTIWCLVPRTGENSTIDFIENISTLAD